ncbi:hypothetical protein ACFQZE_14295 [Paenibacillus sp. GCM10027627]|uniref:hypothetical protein n=1 Tax=unclassified Paenibacillus TaxID=185978 RepID=UPI003639F3F2
MKLKLIKWSLAFSLGLASVSLSPVSASAGLLNNGGFETYVSGSTASDWYFDSEGYPATYTSEIVTTPVSEGMFAHRLSQDGVTKLGQSLSIDSKSKTGLLVGGQKVRLSFDANILSMVAADLTPSIKFWATDGTYLGKLGKAFTTPTTGYSLLQIDIEVPAGTSKYSIEFESEITADGGYYNLYIDNVHLRILDKTEDTAKVGVVGGNLKFSTASGSFWDVRLNNDSTPLNSSMTTTANIIDDRATGDGWSMKIYATDFLSENLSDPTTNGTGTFVLRIPVSSTLKLETSSVVHSAGQAIDPVNGPIANSFTVNNSSQTVVSAQPGFGMGAYKVPITYTLTLPKTLEIVSQTGTGSKFKVGDFVGTRSGFYTATLNYTVGTGL